MKIIEVSMVKAPSKEKINCHVRLIARERMAMETGRSVVYEVSTSKISAIIKLTIIAGELPCPKPSIIPNRKLSPATRYKPSRTIDALLADIIFAVPIVSLIEQLQTDRPDKGRPQRAHVMSFVSGISFIKISS